MNKQAAKQRADGLWECRCGKCGHEWVSRTADEPIRCAKCKTPYWRKG